MQLIKNKIFRKARSAALAQALSFSFQQAPAPAPAPTFQNWRTGHGTSKPALWQPTEIVNSTSTGPGTLPQQRHLRPKTGTGSSGYHTKGLLRTSCQNSIGSEVDQQAVDIL